MKLPPLPDLILEKMGGAEFGKLRNSWFALSFRDPLNAIHFQSGQRIESAFRGPNLGPRKATRNSLSKMTELRLRARLS